MFKTGTLLILLCTMIPLANAKVYTWVDDQGRTHFGDKPPAEGANQLKLPKSTTAPAPSPSAAERRQTRQRMLDIYQKDREAKKAEQAKAKQEAKKLRKRCANARDQLERYTQSAIYENSEDGERRWLSDEEREKEIAGLRKAIKQNCKGE